MLPNCDYAKLANFEHFKTCLGRFEDTVYICFAGKIVSLQFNSWLISRDSAVSIRADNGSHFVTHELYDPSAN